MGVEEPWLLVKTISGELNKRQNVTGVIIHSEYVDASTPPRIPNNLQPSAQ
jgi:hypothetical protein